MKKLLLTLLFIAVGWKFLTPPGEINYGPGVLVPELPQQEEVNNPNSFKFNDYQITPLANFDIQAKVLSQKSYTFGREADLSPVDFALGWGRMSDEAILENIEISQSGRWYRWRTQSLPIPRREIETHSANMHIIPADEEVEYQIEQTRTGEIVTLSGYLVKIEADDGWHWQSSLTRDDVGNHACEVFWVENFQINRL